MQNNKSSNLSNIYNIKYLFSVIIMKYNNLVSKIKSLFIKFNHYNIINHINHPKQGFPTRASHSN